MAVPVNLTGGNFTDSEGIPVQSGTITFELSQDAQVNSNEQVCGGIIISYKLDPTGNLGAPGQVLWPNDILSPGNTFYKVTVYSADGQLVWGPNSQQVLSSPNPFDVGAWVPNQLFFWNPPLLQILLQTNGVNNIIQNKLNLVAGAGVTLVSDSSGDVFISSPGGSVIGYINEAFSATPIFDATLYQIVTFDMTLTGNVTSSSLIGLTDGDMVTFKINQNGAGGHTFVFPANVNNTSVINSAANSINTQTFISVGGQLYPIGPMIWS